MDNHLPIYLTLTAASKKYEISIETLNNLLKSGIIEAITSDRGAILVSQKSIETNLPKDKIIQLRYQNLIGVPITLTEASKKYNVPRNTLFNWAKIHGYVTVIRDGWGMTLDEADVACCSEIYNRRKKMGVGVRGVPLLTDDGREYQLKRPDVSRYRREKRLAVS